MQCHHLIGEPLERPSWSTIRRSRTGDGNQMGLFVPVKFLMAWLRTFFGMESCFATFLDKRLPNTFDGTATDMECLTNVLVGPVRLSYACISLQENPCMGEFSGGSFSCRNSREKMVAFWLGSKHFIALCWHGRLLKRDDFVIQFLQDTSVIFIRQRKFVKPLGLGGTPWR